MGSPDGDAVRWHTPTYVHRRFQDFLPVPLLGTVRQELAAVLLINDNILG